jgi:putative FmdB family regulatory protein
MPTYQYRREDGTEFELEQRITEPSLSVCPDTGQPVRRVISGKAGLIFKGDGFYLTDYTNYGKSGESKPKEDKADASTGTADAKPAEATAKTEAPKTASKPAGESGGSAKKGD